MSLPNDNELDTLDAVGDESLIGELDELPEDDGEADGEPVEGFSLQSPEMAAKMQVMHENMPLRAQLEAAIFAAPAPIKADELLNLVSHKIGLPEIEAELASLKQEYEEKQGGFTLESIKGVGYQFQTNPVAAPIMATMFASRPRPLSRAALETLAIIAYRQPCTRAAVEYIRGVDAGSIIKNLLDRNLIRCVGRKEDAGRPMLFGTTDEFLQVFGIPSIKDLPPLSAFQPTSDTMRESLKELDQIDGAVAVEGFVADPTEAEPEFSEGLLADAEAFAEPLEVTQPSPTEEIQDTTDLPVTVAGLDAPLSEDRFDD